MGLVTILAALPADGASPSGMLANTTGLVRLTISLSSYDEQGQWQLCQKNADSGQWSFVNDPRAILTVGPNVNNGALVGQILYEDPDGGANFHVVQVSPQIPEGGSVNGAAGYLTAATAVSGPTMGASTVSTLHATGAITADSTLSVAGALTASAALTVGTTLAVTGATTLNGAVTLGDAAADDVTFSGVIAGNVTLKKEGAHTIAIGATTTSATAGGALTVAAAAGVTTGAGGALALVGGAGGNDAVGGALSITGGAAGGGNRAGGAVSHVGGAGSGSAAGGASSVVGGAGGATGAGGAIAVTGGAGGATSGTGGAVAIAGGAGTNGNANGGALSLDGGAKNGSGTDGAINIGVTAGAYVNFGKKQRATASANVIADPGTGAAIPVTDSGVCMITTAGAETNTIAIPTFIGQRIALICDVYVGNRVITSSQSINQANNTIMTFGAAADMIELTGMQVGGALRWRVTANDGVALS